MTPSEHGKRMYADRLCQEGRFEKAREYCAKHRLTWPPFPGKGVPAEVPAVATALMEAVAPGVYSAVAVVAENLADSPVPNGSEPTANVVIDLTPAGTGGNSAQEPSLNVQQPTALPQAPSPSPITAPTSTEAAPICEVQPLEVPRCTSQGDVGVGAPSAVLANTDSAAGSRDEPSSQPDVREAVVTHECLNRRLVGIEFANGERASMWRPFKNRRRYDRVKVKLAAGESGPNGIWEELTA